jgi:hypothetical protein
MPIHNVVINNSLSGGDDDAHGNQTLMEMTFEEGNAGWEITRYAGVLHGYTNFGSDAYNLVADARSWESMMSAFVELMAVPQKTMTETEPEATNPPEVTDPEQTDSEEANPEVSDPDVSVPTGGSSDANAPQLLAGVLTAVGLFVIRSIL